MIRQRILFISSVVVLLLAYGGCKRDYPTDLTERGYPVEIAKIMLTKCAVSGCHDSKSAAAAAGLDLTSWTTLFAGTRNGASAVPYAHKFSTLFLFTNHFDDLGQTVRPTMPLRQDPLSRDEVILLRDWIDAGAPNDQGKVAFANNPQRSKYYVTNQGCDVVTVFDQETGLPMRFIPVGAEGSIESPHNIKLSPDGRYWYVSFSIGRYLEKYSTETDQLIARALLGPSVSSAFGSWNTVSITPDGQWAYVVDWSPVGRVAQVNLNTMTLYQTFQGSNLLTQPHGSAIHPNGDTLYVTSNFGNYIYKFDISFPTLASSPEKFPIDGTSIPANINSENPHDILFAPDGKTYYITSQYSNRVQAVNVATNQITQIPVGIYPQEMAVSSTRPYLFVTCTEDTLTYPGNRGSVYIINTNTNVVIGTVKAGFQSHGIWVDEAKGVVVVANRNISPGGPAPHHTTDCGGRNGYVTLIDMNTLQLIPGYRVEVAADPYSLTVRP
jgi:YVTN family beta-propeller protein